MLRPTIRPDSRSRLTFAVELDGVSVESRFAFLNKLAQEIKIPAAGTEEVLLTKLRNTALNGVEHGFNGPWFPGRGFDLADRDPVALELGIARHWFT
jgi:hypothetical protein